MERERRCRRLGSGGALAVVVVAVVVGFTRALRVRAGCTLGCGVGLEAPALDCIARVGVAGEVVVGRDRVTGGEALMVVAAVL
jgi:hypothetical protein